MSETRISKTSIKFEYEITLKDVEELLDIHIEYVKNILKFKLKTNMNLRLPNFPESISERIVKEYICKYEDRDCTMAKTGDLEILSKNIKIEVKCFTSVGPYNIN